MNRIAPPDQSQRERALDSTRSIIVQAPAGSGKTDLLTRRFLRLLSEVDEPSQVVAITFTIAAAAEMRHRVLTELEKAAAIANEADDDEFSMTSLARRAFDHSQKLCWKLLDLPAQLRISTIDSFCRDLALQQPLLSGFGGELDIAEQPRELYRRAARRTLSKIDDSGSLLSASIESLLLWRDNNWQEMEELLVEMLGVRDRWMHDFLLESEPDWELLRDRLERPFVNAVRHALTHLDQLFSQLADVQEELLALARFACSHSDGQLHRELAELVQFPSTPHLTSESLEDARLTYVNVAELLLTNVGSFRKQIDKRLGFPADRKREKARLVELIAVLSTIPGLETALSAVRSLPPARYTEEDWLIVRACFTLLRHAAGELKIVFAEAGVVDFVEVAQIAQSVLTGHDGLPTDAAIAVSDSIRHLLIDEFQDTSRRQHQLLARLIAAWPERTNRTCFAVGDPMQSIYFFRDADAELFQRVKTIGLEIAHDEPLYFDFVSLQANFRTAPSLVAMLNKLLGQIFASNDGSGIQFSSAVPAREGIKAPTSGFHLHLDFVPRLSLTKSVDRDSTDEKEFAHAVQIEEMVDLIRSYQPHVERARASGDNFRIAVLGRTHSALVPVAEALRTAAIPFRAVDLEKLSARPEISDALALARALFNHQDRVAWLGVLRAPWCGLSLADLHLLTSDDDRELQSQPVSELLDERLHLLSKDGCFAVARVLRAMTSIPSLRSTQPTTRLGTLLESIWLQLGGVACVNSIARANLDLLWSCLDRLPSGEPDLLGAALDVALDKLTALPDPHSGSDCGVQLMTIHKSKGLEFEVVIVPELQASGGRGSNKMLSWFERGLENPDESGEITEFLIAPFQPKGAERGNAKAWVDQVYRERESQEMRRILYVAATRAREDLHFFARPAYRVETDGTLNLAEPSNSLLAAAWPGLDEEIHARFEEWRTTKESNSTRRGQVIESLAASDASNLLVMPSVAKPTRLHRLPPDYQIVTSRTVSTPGSRISFGEMVRENNSLRHEGGPLSRALGTAVHSLLEELAQLRQTNNWEVARSALQQFVPRITAQIRACGMEQPAATQITANALEQALNASHDPIGQWILSPHVDAANELRWTGVVDNTLRTVRVDRLFRAGDVPQAEGEDNWWIIDYKTADAGNLDQATELTQLRKMFAPQLKSYAHLLRNIRGLNTPIRVGLYYPRMLLLDWWEL